MFFYFYFAIEEETQCLATDESNAPLDSTVTTMNTDGVESSYTNVSYYFNIVIIALIGSGCIDLFYEIINIIAVNNAKLKALKRVLRFKDIISLLIIVLMHLVRLSHAGKVCSGDYLISSEGATE